MCGITGLMPLQGLALPNNATSLVSQMILAIQHRGPDGHGVEVTRGAAFGHARLAVIDLSPAGRQPMMSADRRHMIVFNGEIYNFKALRAELISIGYQFKSATDTEVILHGYNQWGRGIFSRLRGMFAIAIWDGEREELVLARDRIGKKPLYYGIQDQLFLFGSEIKSLLAFPGFTRRADLQAIHHYLTYQYVPAPWSAFTGIQKLPPGSVFVVRKNGEIDNSRYWELPEPSLARARPISDLRAELHHLLREAVRLRLVSDVPIGAFLSGGVDSSAVVAMMAEESHDRVKTFCIGFEESDYDEREYARMVAKRYNTDHHEMVVRPNAVEILPKLIWHYNEPFADPSAVATFYVSEIARRQVTVVLNGDGGDESFLGYGRYAHAMNSEWISDVPRPVRQLAAAVSRSLPAHFESYLIPRVMRRWMSYLSEQDSRRYAPSIAYFFEQDKAMGYGDSLKPYLRNSSLDLLERYFKQSPSYVGGAAWADIHTYLPDDLLVKVDVATMAHGLEARSPLLDHVLMEWAAKIPVKQKLTGGETKALLKSVMEPYLPREVLYRPKMGFGVPIDHWLKSELKTFAFDTLLSVKARQRGLIEPDYVRMMLDEHCSGRRLHHTRLWALLMLELWFQMWIDPGSPPLSAINNCTD
jgi:asparagine synthase (glutamine-hydrolysing)